MIGLLLGLAAMGMAPEPLNLRKWLASDEFPTASDLRGGIPGARVEIVVDDTGVPLRCDVVAPTGSPSLDLRACQFATTRARFKAARDEDDHVIAGVYALPVDRRPAATPWADMTMSLSRMPVGPSVVQLRLIIDPTGKVETCTVAIPSGNPALDRIACSALTSAAQPPIRDGEGRAIRALRLTSVGFVAGRGVGASPN